MGQGDAWWLDPMVGRGLQKTQPAAQHAQIEWALFQTFVGPLMGLFVAAYGGGSVAGAEGSRWWWWGAEKWLEKSPEKSQQQGRRLVRNGGLGRFLGDFLALLRQSMSWVLQYALQAFNWLKNQAIGDVLAAQNTLKLH